MSQEQRCSNGHFYNPAKFSSCPHCGVSGIDIGPTKPGVAVGGGAGHTPTMPMNMPSAPQPVGPAPVPMAAPMPAPVQAPPPAPVNYAMPGNLERHTAPIDRAAPNVQEQVTRPWYPSAAAENAGPAERRIDPIVGWLVCIEGPDRGRDFRIKPEKNFVGRSTSMDICIPGDPRVSRENHAIVLFDPRNTEFKLYPGDARGLVYLNGSMIDTPNPLKPFDKIELGDTQLVFVPFCGEHFKWPEKL